MSDCVVPDRNTLSAATKPPGVSVTGPNCIRLSAVTKIGVDPGGMGEGGEIGGTAEGSRPATRVLATRRVSVRVSATSPFMERSCALSSAISRACAASAAANFLSRSAIDVSARRATGEHEIRSAAARPTRVARAKPLAERRAPSNRSPDIATPPSPPAEASLFPEGYKPRVRDCGRKVASLSAS